MSGDEPNHGQLPRVTNISSTRTRVKSEAADQTRRRRSPNAPPAGHAAFSIQAGTTIADAVHRRLRKDIVSMKLVPGTPISEKEVAHAENVSRTPVREAVLRLAEERLVEVVPKSGTFVARIPLSALPEAIVARRALEGVTVRAAAQHAGRSQVTELVALVQRQEEAAGRGDLVAFHKADEDFHAAIARIGRYPGIWDLIQQVKVQIDRYRRLTLPQEGRMGMVASEHLAVVRAIEAGDADLAAARMEEHLGKLQLDIAVFRDMWPDYFVHDLAFDEGLLA
jgi:DNA-binding GntR family transcriptional regulator